MPTVDELKKRLRSAGLKTTGLKAVLVDRLARLVSCKALEADRVRVAVAPKAKKPDYGQLYADWQECERKRRELEAADEFKTTNFRFAAREFSNGVRKCVLDEYNSKAPPGERINALIFARNLPPLDTALLKKSFESVGVSYGLVDFVRRSIKLGDAIAHKYNTANHKELKRLLKDLPDVRVPEMEKEEFARLAECWEKSISAMVGAGKWKKKQNELEERAKKTTVT